MSTMTLEPCPFCGKSGPFDQWPCEWLDATEANIVRCPYCHGAAPMATWNTRAHLAQPAQAVDVGAIREVAASIDLRAETYLDPQAKTWANMLTAALAEKGNG